uniref:protein-histidine N-methyltransferase n=1 Tax=Setaria digitata TaxID=48799 RepID=A0A915Q319_9BILA
MIVTAFPVARANCVEISRMRRNCGDRKEGVERVELSSGHCLYYIDRVTLSRNVKERGYQDDPAFKQIAHSDRCTGIYEGGFKIWECAIDLCEYIDKFLEPQILNKKILEVGCGAGLPSILALQKGAKEAVLQDYNDVVINCFTKDNFTVNNVSMKNSFFYGCDWRTLQEKMIGQKFDVILTSETIYNEEHYGILHDLLDIVLPPNGLLAAKMFYFGVGGNIPAFVDFVKMRGIFNTYICWSSETDVPRKIVQLTRKFAS